MKSYGQLETGGISFYFPRIGSGHFYLGIVKWRRILHGLVKYKKNGLVTIV